MIVTKMGSRVYSQELSFSETLVTGGSDDDDAVLHSGICKSATGKAKHIHLDDRKPEDVHHTPGSIQEPVRVRGFNVFTHTELKNRKKRAIYSQHPQAQYEKNKSLCSVRVPEKVHYELHS